MKKNKENSSSTSIGPKQYPTCKAAPKTIEKFAQTSDDVCAVVCVGT